MNYLALLNFQRIIFSILFILSGLYLIIFLLKEIFMLFIPKKKTQTIDMYQLLTNNKDVKIMPLTGTPKPEVTVKNKYIQPEVIKKHVKSPSVIKLKKERKKSRKRKE